MELAEFFINTAYLHALKSSSASDQNKDTRETKTGNQMPTPVHVSKIRTKDRKWEILDTTKFPLNWFCVLQTLHYLSTKKRLKNVTRKLLKMKIFKELKYHKKDNFLV